LRPALTGRDISSVMPAIIRDSTPPPSVRCSMMPLGRPRQGFTEEPEITKPVLRKHLIDDMTDFHGFITPGGKLSSQRLEDECSTALPSQCTTGSLESLPTTPAGFGTFLEPPVSGAGFGTLLQPSVSEEVWFPGKGLGLPSLDAHDGHPDCAAFSSYFFDDMELPDMSSDFKRALTAFSELATPPSTPRQERTADRTCPLAPGDLPYPTLLKALTKDNLDLVSNALESDPDSACAPFWDHNAEPPLCAAIRLGCKLDIVDLLLKSGADVKATNFASQNPLDVLASASYMRTVASSKELEEVLLSAGAEPSENSATFSQENEVMRNDMLRWDSVIDAGNLYDFGLPPSLGSFHDFDRLFEVEPPPPVGAVA